MTTMPRQSTLSVVLIVKNEAENLRLCLESVRSLADEIIVVDSGSSDQTEQVARQFTSQFIVHDDWPGFGRQRQIAQSYANCDYILWLDADERISPELHASLESVLAQPVDTHVLYQISRLSWVFGRFIRHCGWYPDRVTRLYARQLTTYNDALVHEKVIIPPKAKIQTLDGDLLHYTYRNLEHYLVKSAGYAAAWATQRQKIGKKSSISSGILHAIGCFLKMYIVKAGFLDGKQGFLLSVLSAHSTFVKYADLWIKNLDHSTKN